MRSIFLAAVVALAGTLIISEPAAAQGAEPRVLIFSKTAGFRHASIPYGIQMLEALGAERGFAVDHTEDSEIFNDERLGDYDAVVFLSTTGNILDGTQQAAFEQFVESGGGFVGIHAAADTEYDWPWYGELVGAYFESHPHIQNAAVVVNDRVHPSTDMLPLRWERSDEWYNYRENPRGKVHVLLTLDEDTYVGGEDGYDHPIAWCRPFNGGRSWYTGGGHTESSYNEPLFRDHVAGGVLWAVGLAEGDCSATIDANFEKTILDDDTTDPMELTVLPDGRIAFVERSGAVKVHDPSTSQTNVAGRLPVYTGQEDGLLGITHDPNFTENGWVYLFYSPAGTVAKQRISRLSLNGNVLDRQSEQVLLEIPTQRDECCHSGGSLAFGPDGSLYASLGDDTNPFASDGFAPIDERADRAAWDAQRTSGNTQDLRGKILRIMPQPDGGYTIPEGNLFEDPAEGRPEIYVMGNRNPFRISVDPETGWLYWGDVGPDSRSTSTQRGPRGYDEYNQARRAGNYGWPFCIADNQAYRDYDFASGQSGGYFDCTVGPTNRSPNNTGAERVPATEPAWIWYPYANSTEFPELNEGDGRTAMAGPVFHFDASNGSRAQLPSYYDGTVFIYEWSRNWIREVKLDEAGDVLKINPFLPSVTFVRPMDMELGPDGAIYMIEWGSGFGGGNNDSRVVRISYGGGSHAPVARAVASPTSGPLPLTVAFDGQESYDPDPAGHITFAWDFDEDGTVDSEEPNGSHTYLTPGNFSAQLTVTDSDGLVGVASVPIVAGNTQPVVSIASPRDGGFFDWGDVIPFSIRVEDAEDGSLDAGSIPCEAIVVQPGIGHDDHNHTLKELDACEEAFVAAPPGHGDSGSNVFHVLTATYTDAGAEGVGALSAAASVMLRPKRLQAEHFSREEGVRVIELAGSGGGGRAIWTNGDDHISFAPVNLSGIDSVTFRVASYTADGWIEMRADGVDGPLIARIDIPATGGPHAWADVAATVADPGRTHELFLIFKRAQGVGSLFILDYMNFGGSGIATGVRDGSIGLPQDEIVLHEAYPNPFTDETRLTFYLDRSLTVQLSVYDLLGRQIATLVDGPTPAGLHSVSYRAGAAASGVYFYRLTTPLGTIVRQMVVFH